MEIWAGMAGQVLAGYALVVMTPGPNVLLVADAAARHGMRAALPRCGANALAVGLIAGVAQLASGALPRSGPALDVFALASGVLLLLAALRIARSRPGQRQGGLGASFLTSFRTAVLNPVTIAYFATAFTGPLVGTGLGAGWVVAAGAAALSLCVCLGWALLLGRPAVQRAVATRQTQFRLGTAVLLAAAAASTLAGAANGIAQAAAF
ncbi:LysE family transporter [Roseomonas sp. PWR1]|uniref:LysE family transporter n=1 Tax=Roseomonas nitratireducens TaxID=2820810 RepID=A0ABS4AWQ5_9PROT|nr:LysE family transporter [Neoroseomonas nitratireducens]MBP0465206.1 LysE family transporter [Neoroseomonas nitratireducens]